MLRFGNVDEKAKVRFSVHLTKFLGHKLVKC